MLNPYESVEHDRVRIETPSKDLRKVSYVLAFYAVVLGFLYLPRYLFFGGWGGYWNWCFGVAPSYLVFSSLIAVVVERRKSQLGYIILPVVLAPLLLVTGLIVFILYIDFVSGPYPLMQYLLSLWMASLCPVLWYYFFVATHRAWQIAGATASVNEGMDSEETAVVPLGPGRETTSKSTKSADNIAAD